MTHYAAMVTVTYVHTSGAEQVVDLKSGISVMEGALQNNVPGIQADCGGACACATCHVHVDPAWTERIGPRLAIEESLLDFVENVQATSRLSCQIKLTDALHGLIVRIPGDES